MLQFLDTWTVCNKDLYNHEYLSEKAALIQHVSNLLHTAQSDPLLQMLTDYFSIEPYYLTPQDSLGHWLCNVHNTPGIQPNKSKDQNPIKLAVKSSKTNSQIQQNQ